MAGLFPTLFIALLIGGLALMSHWARKNQGAEVSLIIIVGFLSLLTLGLAGLLALSQASGAVSPEEFSPVLFTVVIVAFAVTGLAGLALCVAPLLKVTGRRSVGRLSDPPVFFAAWLYVVVLGVHLALILAFEQTAQVLTTAEVGRVSIGAILTSQLPFIVIALLGVGIGVRRDLREVLLRLGYGPVSLANLGVVVLFVVAALGLSFLSDALFSLLQPDLYDQVGEITASLFSTEGLSFPAVIAFALLLGFGAALGEETLFRGAVQPVFGIPLTSLLFAALHVQYGPSVSLVYIFVLAVGLGLLRRYMNTTACLLAHAGYNGAGVILAYLFGASV